MQAKIMSSISDDNSGPTPAQPRSLRRRLLRNEDGVAAIEFAILALPFFLLVFAIIESSISFAGQQLLQNATDDYARQIRTGQLRTADVSQTGAKAFICQRISLLVESGCPGLIVDLKEYSSFEAAAAVSIKYTTDRDIDSTGFGAAPGGPISINMLRVFYKWPVLTDFMRSYMSNLKGGKVLHYATTTWQNEPY
jgi:Flp pilus assembly protein TadG